MFKTYLTRILTEIASPFEYLKARLVEPLTWAGIIGAVTAANSLSRPWDYIAAACGAIMALLPTSKMKDDAGADGSGR